VLELRTFEAIGLPETNATMSTSRNAVEFAANQPTCGASSNIGAIAGPATKLAVNICVSEQFAYRCNRLVSTQPAAPAVSISASRLEH
jgi:hypothetical protein